MIRTLMICRSCGYSMEISIDNIPEVCPRCGSTRLEILAYRSINMDNLFEEDENSSSEEEKPLLADHNNVFITKVSEGEWEVDLGKVFSDDVSIAELEPGEYEIIFYKIKKI